MQGKTSGASSWGKSNKIARLTTAKAIVFLATAVPSGNGDITDDVDPFLLSPNILQKSPAFFFRFTFFQLGKTSNSFLVILKAFCERDG